MHLALRGGHRLHAGQPLPSSGLLARRAMTTLSDKEYDELALPELRALVAALDAVEDASFEAELSSDILAIEFSDGDKYVINSHRAARQIWMAAQRSAWHFDWDGTAWFARKSGDELWATISRLLSGKLGRPFELSKR